MYRLKLLGGVLLEGPEGPVSGPAVQQRRLALLALLGSAGDRGRSRDQLISLLWPETAPSEARQHLSHSLYSIRRALGQEAIRTAGEYVRLSGSLVAVDLLAFDRALEAGDGQAATEAYAGPFMEGFFVDGAPEFERWVDAERRRVASEFGHSLESLARVAVQAGDSASAVEWWERLAAHDPYNSAAVVGLMDALAAVGDPANAIQIADTHLRVLADELGMAPPDEVLTRVLELQRERNGSSAFVIGMRPDTPIPTAYEGVHAAQTRHPLLTVRTALASVAVLGGAAVLWGLGSRAGPTVEFVPNAVMIRGVENLTGDSSLDGMGRYAAYMLEGALAGIEAVRVVTAEESEDIREGIEEVENLAGVDLVREAARHLRAGLVLESSFLARGDSLLLEARLIAPETGVVLDGMRATASVRDPVSGVQALGDKVMISVATHLQLGGQYSPSYARGTSFQAWQEVDTARRLWAESGREREAFALLQRALDIDSTFDAAVGLAMIWHVNFGEFVSARSMAAELERRIAHLPPRQRWQLAVTKSVLRRDRPGIVGAFGDWVERLPNASRLLHLASAQLVAQRPAACLETLDEVDLAGSRYARSGWLWLLYAECYRALGDYSRSLNRIRAGRSRFPGRRNLVVPEALALAGLGDAGGTARLVEDYLVDPAPGETFEHESVFELLVNPALEITAHGYNAGADRAHDRAIDWYEARSAGGSASAANRWRLARSLYAAERWEEARRAFGNLSAAELSGHRDLLTHNIDVSLIGYQATLAARLGDDRTADSLDAALSRMRRPLLWGHATYWRAAIAAVQGDSAGATELLGRAMGEGLFAVPWGSEYPKWEYHIDPDFRPLLDYAPFRELVAPRG